MKNDLQVTLHRLNQPDQEITFPVYKVFNAGWAGSDRAAVQHHIDELVAMGVPAPRHVPTLFALGNHMVTTSEAIQVHGDETSGEVEYVLLWYQGELLLTVGSDHSDRRLESHSIPKAKNICLNVMARDAWPYREVREHFGQLELSCHVVRGGVRSLYQMGPCKGLLAPECWVDDLRQRSQGLNHGLVFFSGTIATVAGLAVGEAYEFSLADPVLKREITHRYACEVLTGAIEDY